MVILNERQTRFLINLLLFLTFDLMLLGAGVRTMDAGLTCPDWPMCFGKAIPDYHFGVYLEFIHRVIAGILSLIFLVFFIGVWKNQAFKKLRVFSLISLFLLVAQVIMGGLTVLKLLEAYIVTMHLTLATCFLVSLYVMKLKLKDHSQLKQVKKSIWP
ncbi:MAG: COX15/CtaA family protein, partial [Bdellovibrionales bacterium]|nr:COX15/CtaA family protein [Bdellovibrionales bacterium]NQZ19111.1 COX15/CtaA family protein [Bdellovibrionales bacterium]